MTNRLEQNKQMIAELRAMSGRLERIEARLAQRLDVRVTEMPPVRLTPESKSRLEKQDKQQPDKAGDKPAGEGK
jgi:hypothetical protein